MLKDQSSDSPIRNRNISRSLTPNRIAASPLKRMEYPLCEKGGLHEGERLTWACLFSTCREELMFCNQCVKTDLADKSQIITVKELLNQVIGDTEEFYNFHQLNDIKGNIKKVEENRNQFEQYCDDLLKQISGQINKVREKFQNLTQQSINELQEMLKQQLRFQGLKKYFEDQNVSKEKVIELYKFDAYIEHLRQDNIGLYKYHNHNILESIELVKQNIFDYSVKTLNEQLSQLFDEKIKYMEFHLQKNFHNLLYDQVYDYDVVYSNNFRTKKDQFEPLKTIAFSKNGKLFATAGNDSVIRLYDTKSCLQITSFKGHTGTVQSLIFSNDDEKLFSGAGDKAIKIWSVTDFSLLATLTGHTAQVSSLSLSKDGLLLLSASYDTTIKVWNLETQECISTLLGHSQSVLQVNWSEDNQYLLSLSFDQTIKQWTKDGYHCTNTLKNVHNYHFGVNASSNSQNRQFIAIAGPQDAVTILNAKDLTVQQTITNVGLVKVCAVQFTKNNKQIIASGINGEIKILDCSDAKKHSDSFKGHHAAVTAFSLSNDELKLLSASDDASFKCWDLTKSQNKPQQ